MFYRFGLVVLLAVSLSGCFLTKVVTVPMRIVGAVVPVIGDAMDEIIEAVADAVDDIPL